MTWRVLGVGVAASLAWAGPLLAHHSFSAEFEADKTAELKGKIVQVWWNNPHIRYRLQVTGAGGATDDWGRALFAATDHYQDPALRCLALGLPRLFGSPYNMEIVDAGTHYVMLHVEHNTPRRIWMDGRKPAADTQPSSLGFSVGRWEDDVLVIETTHLLPGWLDGSGLPMKGEGTRVVERYELADDRLSIDRIMTIYDPYYTQPLVRRRGSARDDNIDISEQASCDPDSYYRDLVELGRLEQHLDGQ
jgi:hypothetical protein